MSQLDIVQRMLDYAVVPVIAIEDDFVLEAGMAHVTSVMEHPGRTVLLAAAIEPGEGILPGRSFAVVIVSCL